MKRLILMLGFVCLTPSCLWAQEIIFAGDVTLARNINPQKQATFFAPETKERIEQADLFIWNCEFSGKSQTLKDKPFVFSADARNALADFKFANGVACIANNHSFDGGVQGIKNLIADLQANDIVHVGLKKDRFLKHGDKAGNIYYILNYSPICRSSGDEDYDTPRFEEIQETLAYLNSIIEDREREFIIVNVHDGIEKTLKTSERQREQAQKLSEAGADVISFSHSHTYIEPTLINDGRSLVLWGIGNFIFGGNQQWRNKKDVRMISANPKDKSWKWMTGDASNYVYSIREDNSAAPAIEPGE